MHRSAAPFSSPTSAHSPTCSSVTSPVGGRNRNNHNNNTNCGCTRRQLTSSSSFPSSPSGDKGSPLSAIIAGSAASSMGTGPKPQQQQQQQQQRRSSLVPSSSTNSLTQAIGEDKEGKRKTTSRRQLRRSRQQQQQQLWVDAVTTAAATAGGGHADDGGHLNDESDRDRVAPSRCDRAGGEEDEGHRWSRTAPQATALAVPTSIVKSQSNDDADSDDDSSGSRASGDSGSAGHVETTVLSLQGAQKEKERMAKELTCRDGSGNSKNNSSGSESESGPERKPRRGSSGSGMRPRTPPPKKPHVRGNSKKTAKQRAATEAAIAAAATSSASSSLASPAYPAWTPAWTPAGTRLGGRAGAVPRSFMGSQTEHPVILGGGSAGLAPAASAFSPLLSSSDASPTTATTIRGEPAPTPQQALKSLSPSTQARMMKRQQQQLAQQHVARSRREQRSQRTHERQWGRDQKVESTLVGLPSPSTQLAANPSGGALGSSSSGSDEGGNSNGPNAPHHLGRCRSSTSQHNGTGQSSPSPSPGGTRPNRHGQSNEEEDNQQEEEEDRRGGATTPTAAPGRPPHTGIAGRARPSVTIIAPVSSPKEVSPAPTHPPPPTQHQSVDAAPGSNGVLSSSIKGKVGGSRGDGVAATPATAAAAVRSSPPPPLPRSVSGEKLTYVEAALKPAPTASAAFSASMAGKKLPSRRALHVGTPGANLFIALPQAPSTNVKTRRAEGTGPQGSSGGGESTMVSGCRYPNYGGPHASSSDHPQALPQQQQHASPCGAASGLSSSSPLYQANGGDQNGHTPHHDHPTPQFFHESIVRHLNGLGGGGGGGSGGCSNARGLISGGCNYGYGSDFSESVSGGSPPPYPFDSDEDEEAFYYNSLGSPNTFDPTSSGAGAGGGGAPLSPGQRARIRLAQQRRLAAATRSMKAVRKPPRAFCSNCCGVIPALKLSRSSHHLCLNDLAAGGDEDHPDGDVGTGTGGGGARAVEPKNKQAGEDGEDEEEGSSGGGDCGSPSSAKPPITEGERVSRNEEEEVEEGQVGPSPSAAATTSTASPTLWNSYEHAHHCRCAVPTIDRELQAFSAAEVLPGLYLGANADATNMHALQHHGISLVLNVAEECTVLEEMKRNKHHIRYVQVPLKDHSDEVIAPLFAPLTLLIHQQLHRRQIYEERRKIADATSADVDGEESSHNMGTSPGSPSVGGGSGLVKGNLLGADALGNNNKSFPFSSSPTCVSPTQRGAIIVDADESANPWVATPTVTGQPNLKEGKRETPRTPTPTHPAQPAPSLRSTPQSPFARFSDTATNSTITMMSCNSRPTSLSPSPLPTRAGSTFPLVSTLPPARAQSRSIRSPCARAATADTPPPPPPPTHASPSTATPTAPPICFANQNSGAGGGGGGNSGNGNHVNDPNSNAAGEDGGIVDPRDCGGVLIHCRMGVSRSASFVLAYLILYGMQLARLDARAVSGLFAPGVFDEEKQFIQALGGRSSYGGDDDDDDAAAAAAEKNLSKGGVRGDASAATTYGNGDGDVTAGPPEMEESEDNTTTALNSRSSTNVFTPSPSIVSPSPSVVMGSSAPTMTATTTTRMALDGSANSQDFLTPLQTEAVMPLARPSSLLYGSPTSAPSLTAQQQYQHQQHQQQHDGLVRLNQNMQQQQQMCAGVAAATAPGTHKEAKKTQRTGEQQQQQQQQYGDVDNGSAVCAGGSQEGGADEATHVAPRHCTACTADIASGPLAIATTPTRSPTGMNGMFSSASSLCLTSPRERAAMSCRACHELRLRQHLLDTLSSPTSTLTQYSNHNNSNLSKNNGESCVPAGTGSSSSLGNLRHSALSFREAFDYLKKQKPDVNPNIGFVLALRELAGGGDFSISSSM